MIEFFLLTAINYLLIMFFTEFIDYCLICSHRRTVIPCIALGIENSMPQTASNHITSIFNSTSTVTTFKTRGVIQKNILFEPIS